MPAFSIWARRRTGSRPRSSRRSIAAAPAGASRSGAAGRGDGGGGRGRAGRGHRADRRRQLPCRGDRLQAGPHQPGLEYQEPVLAARRGAAGQVADPGQLCWRSLPCSASPGNCSMPPFSTVRAGDAGLGRLRTACWLPPGCSSAGRQSTTWWSGRAASRG